MRSQDVPSLVGAGGRGSHHRSAVTLLEVLLVLALIVLVSAMAIPNFRTAFSDQRLKQSAEIVRAEWARARLQAIKTGRVQVFQHAVGGARFVTMPQVAASGAAGFPVLPGQPQTGPAGFGIDPYPDTLVHIQIRQLPAEVRFMGADVQLDQRSAVQLSNLTEMQSETGPVLPPLEADSLQERAVEWGMPIFFFPDGTCSNARIVLANERQRGISIWLRGMTGAARLDRVQPVDQFGPLEGRL